MFPSIVVSGGVHSKNLRKGDGECLRASVAISTLSSDLLQANSRYYNCTHEILLYLHQRLRYHCCFGRMHVRR